MGKPPVICGKHDADVAEMAAQIEEAFPFRTPIGLAEVNIGYRASVD